MASVDKIFDSIKALGKIALLSRHTPNIAATDKGDTLIILANGPSLKNTIQEYSDILSRTPTMAVNFAAITDEFFKIQPRYYILADPHFFSNDSDNNLTLLEKNIGKVDWTMTILVPHKFYKSAQERYATENVDIATFNDVGIEGAEKLCHIAFARRLAMPRPRNVLIPSIMIGIWLGYKHIYITGADHSWMQTLWVTDENEVVSVQPHFYEDNESEKKRISHVYKHIPLYSIVESFAVAFKSYHQISNFASRIGVEIVNATPGSFIDAFRRGKLSDL